MEIPEEYQVQLQRHGFVPKRVIGSGVSGTVLVAVQKSLEREVAAKVCDGPLARDSADLQHRFRREARLLATIDHPRIPYLLTTGEMPEMLAGTPKVRLDAFDTDLGLTSPEVRAVVRRATQRHEGDRFQTANEFAAELNRLLGGTTSTLMPAVRAVCRNLTCPGAKLVSARVLPRATGI